jgi:hypothetical protein
MTPMDAATLAVLDKIGGIFHGQTAQNVAREIAGAAVGAWLAEIAPMAQATTDPHGRLPCISCSSVVGHMHNCPERT